MSHIETHFGKLQKILLPCSLENWCKEKCNGIGINEITDFNSWEETFKYYFRKDYFIINGEVWYAIEHTELTDMDDIYSMIPNEDKTITFIMQFYNGGTCLSECIEEGLLNLEKKGEI